MQCTVKCVLICIHSYLKSVLIYIYIILDTYHPETLYLREQGCEDTWLFLEAERGPRTKTFGKRWFIVF